MSTIGGSGPSAIAKVKPCSIDSQYHKDGAASSSRFAAPTRIQVLGGKLFVADGMNGCIRSADVGGGSWSSETPCCTADISTGPEGWGPQDLAVSDKYFYLLDSYNNQVKRSPRPFTKWTVLAGNGSRPFHGQSTDGPALQQALNEPHGFAVTSDGSGDIYIAETWSSCVKLLRKGVLTTVAGRCGFGGHADGNPLESRFQHPHTITLDPRDETKLYVSSAPCYDDDGPPDDQKYKPCAKTNGGVCFSGVQLVTLDRTTGLAVNVKTISGKAGKKGKCADAVDGKVDSAAFEYIHGTAFQPLSDDELASKQAGNKLSPSKAIYVCDEDANTIRKIDFDAGRVSTVAGKAYDDDLVDGPALKAAFNYPGGLGLDPQGNIYVGDYENSRIRLISFKNVSVLV